MINPAYPESELTARIIGCAMEVHNVLGVQPRRIGMRMALETDKAWAIDRWVGSGYNHVE
jgi:hypothetical protein